MFSFLSFSKENTQESKETKDTKDTKNSHSHSPTLNHVMVHYANRALKGQYGLTLHGYVVVGGKPAIIKTPHNYSAKTKTIKNFGKVFYLGNSYLHAPFHVSNTLLQEMENATNYSSELKKVVNNMADQRFPTVEHFLRKVVFTLYSKEEKEISQETKDKLNLLAMNPSDYHADTLKLTFKTKNVNDQLIHLINLNYQKNKQYGRIFPYRTSSYFSVKDAEAFESGIKTTEYPHIKATDIYELFQQQQLFQRYIEEKWNMGESVDLVKKTLSNPDEQTQTRLVNFCNYSVLTSYFYANCNTATATLLEEAEQISASRDKRTPDSISSASYLSFGSSQRMFFWNSNINQKIADLFITGDTKKQEEKIKRHLKIFETNSVLFQELVDKKDYILTMIGTWPIEQQKRALEQVLDKNMPLGKVFFGQRSWTWSTPKENQGYLLKAKQLLEALNKDNEYKKYTLVNKT